MTTTPTIPAVSAGLGGFMAEFQKVGGDVMRAAPTAIRGSLAANHRGASMSNQAKHHSMQQGIGSRGGII